MKRRTFLKNTAISGASIALSPYLMKGINFNVSPIENFIDNDNIIIILEMFGGNDGLNTVIPVHNSTYHNIRPNLAYNIDEAVEVVKPSGDDFDGLYFNPALVTDVYKEGMKHIFETGRLAIVEGVGYDNPNLSHFRSQDIFLSGINNSDPKVSLLEGWLGRFILSQLPNYPTQIPDHPLAVCIDRSVSLLFKTKQGHMAIALSDPEKFAIIGDGLNPLPQIPLMDGGDSFSSEFNFVHVIAQQSEMYSKAIYDAWDKGKDKIKVNYSDGLSQKFKLISMLIAGGLKSKIFYVNLSNFDSHAQQMNSDKISGQHPTLLRQVANAVSEFLDDAQQQGWAERVAGMTISEFGRRSYENGSRGTDHGAANVQFVFGGNSDYINGGTYGNSPDLDNLDDNGNVVYQFDFRRTYSDFLINWFGATQQEVSQTFNGEDFLPIGLLNPRINNVNSDYYIINPNNIKIYPNPSFGTIKLWYELRKDASVQIDLFNIKGERVKRYYRGYSSSGIKEFDINISEAGFYFISILINGKRFIKKVQIFR